jgi:exopolyphosphatase/guanosine-5'-triphosphate,3'-diphosphate pyrophosphatase
VAQKKLFAAIDVGSHEIQMKIAELAKEEPPRTVEHLRRTLAIGTDTYLRGRITQAVLNECLDILADFSQTLKNYRIGACRAVATSAFREAGNRTFAIEQIRRASGLSIEILSNAEERHYHILAVMAQLPDFRDLIREGTLLVDISAGSIQITVYTHGELFFSQNMRLGSLRIRELLADLESRTADFAGLMEEYISSDLDGYHLLEPKAISYANLIVLGGGMDLLNRLAGQPPDQPSTLTGKQFSQLYHQLLNTRPLDLALDKAISAEHASLLLPSAIIIRKLADFSSAKSIRLSSATLCDGLLQDMANQKFGCQPACDPAPDILSACRNLARRFAADNRHLEHVEKTALRIFDDTAKLHGLPPRSRILLQATAILHECGKYVSMTEHHVLSYNIIMAHEIIGLRREEQNIVAWATRLQENPTDGAERDLNELDEATRLHSLKLAAILHLADALDAGHRQKTSELAVSLNEHQMILNVTARRDITLEVWTLEGKSHLFREIFGLQPAIQIKRQRT